MTRFFTVCFLLAIAPTLSLAAETKPTIDGKQVDLRSVAVSAPIPEYPYRSRANGHIGKGMFMLTLRPDGTVASVATTASTGWAELDESASKALVRWRFKPGLGKHIQIPVNFIMQIPYRTSHRGYDVIGFRSVVPPSTPTPIPSPSPARRGPVSR